MNIKRIITAHLLLFFLTSFLGWVVETVGTFLFFKEWVDRGLLILPICPIYGFGVLLLFIILKVPSYGFFQKKYQNYKKKKQQIMIVLLYLIYFLLFGLLCGLLEFSTGFVIQTIGKEPLWNYQGYKDALNAHVRLLYLFFFGIGGGLYTRFVYLPLYRRLKAYKSLALDIFVIALSFGTVIDFIIAIIK